MSCYYTGDENEKRIKWRMENGTRTTLLNECGREGNLSVCFCLSAVADSELHNNPESSLFSSSAHYPLRITSWFFIVAFVRLSCLYISRLLPLLTFFYFTDCTQSPFKTEDQHDYRKQMTKHHSSANARVENLLHPCHFIGCCIKGWYMFFVGPAVRHYVKPDAPTPMGILDTRDDASQVAISRRSAYQASRREVFLYCGPHQCWPYLQPITRGPKCYYASLTRASTASRYLPISNSSAPYTCCFCAITPVVDDTAIFWASRTLSDTLPTRTRPYLSHVLL